MTHAVGSEAGCPSSDLRVVTPHVQEPGHDGFVFGQQPSFRRRVCKTQDRPDLAPQLTTGAERGAELEGSLGRATGRHRPDVIAEVEVQEAFREGLLDARDREPGLIEPAHQTHPADVSRVETSVGLRAQDVSIHEASNEVDRRAALEGELLLAQHVRGITVACLGAGHFNRLPTIGSPDRTTSLP